MNTAARAARASVRRFARGTFVLLAVLLVLHPTRAAAQSRLYVQVYEQATGALVSDLDRAEVVVREDGVVRPVLDVRLANLPAKVVILVDNSRAARRGLDRVREGLREFVDRLPPYQEVSLAVLSPRPEWVVQGEIEMDPVREGIDRLELGGRSSRLLDGLVMATEWIDADTGPFRGVLVIVTANGADRSRAATEEFREVIARARREDTTAHMLLMRGRSPMRRAVSLQEAVGRDLETYTEGSFRTASLGSDLREPLAAIADRFLERNRELARQHLVRYERPPDASSGTVHLTVTRFGVRYIVSTDGRVRRAPPQAQQP